MEIRIYDSQIGFLTNNEEEFINSPNNETAIAVLKQTEVLYNDNSGCNTEYCDEHDIKYHKGKINTIGTGVMTSGSLVLTVKRRTELSKNCLSDDFSAALCQYFKDKNLSSVRQDNNDVLVDDYKVASGGEIMINNFKYMGYQISVNQDIEAIDNICLRKSLKQPKALSDYGITTEEMVDFCKNYWNNN